MLECGLVIRFESGTAHGDETVSHRAIFLNMNATKIWVLSNDSFRLANNNSQVPPKIMRHLLAVMQASLEEYKDLWLQYQKKIRYIDS